MEGWYTLFYRLLIGLTVAVRAIIESVLIPNIDIINVAAAIAGLIAVGTAMHLTALVPNINTDETDTVAC
jgi:hypothetical protein